MLQIMFIKWNKYFKKNKLRELLSELELLKFAVVAKTNTSVEKVQSNGYILFKSDNNPCI